jgi:hypothetical protein
MPPRDRTHAGLAMSEHGQIKADRVHSQRFSNLQTIADRFVDGDEAQHVEKSEYEKLSHDAKPPSPRGGGHVLSPRENWNPFFHASGWFASWFSARKIESTTI